MVKRAKIRLAFMISAIFLCTTFASSIAEEPLLPVQSRAMQRDSGAGTLEPFTGRVTGSKVRVRLEPSVDSPILDELSGGDLVVILGEQNGFYAIRPPARTKAFVYRTYIIDDIVEGNHVNVRSEPHLDAPVLVQLNKGDRVDGHVSPINNKWLQIALPEVVRFYVATDYIEHAGDIDLMDRIERRQRDASAKVDQAHVACQAELAKSFEEIDLGKACQELENVIVEYTDVPEQSRRAQRLLSEDQEAYNRKKIDYLQQQAAQASESWNVRCKELAQQMATQQASLEVMEQCLRTRTTEQLASASTAAVPVQHHQPQRPTERAAESAPLTMTDSQPINPADPWAVLEDAFYQRWLLSHPNGTLDDFYNEQGLLGMQVHGSVQPYRRLIKAKPGNFVLIDHVDDIPIAFLYSTKVNLDSLVGRKVMLKVAPRPNNNFAFPAYFVLDIASVE